MPDIPDTLAGLPVHWAGVDDTTPDGCTLVGTAYLGLPTVYIVRDGQVIGRIEFSVNGNAGYVGQGLKGGSFVGSGDQQTLAAKIADRAA